MPVLPATWMPGRFAATPVPSVTTARISPVRTLAFALEVTWTGLAALFSAGSLTIEVGLANAAVGDGLGDGRHAERRGEHLALSEGRHREIGVASCSALRSVALGIVMPFGCGGRRGGGVVEGGRLVAPVVLGGLDQVARRRP